MHKYVSSIHMRHFEREEAYEGCGLSLRQWANQPILADIVNQVGQELHILEEPHP